MIPFIHFRSLLVYQICGLKSREKTLLNAFLGSIVKSIKRGLQGISVENTEGKQMQLIHSFILNFILNPFHLIFTSFKIMIKIKHKKVMQIKLNSNFSKKKWGFLKGKVSPQKTKLSARKFVSRCLLVSSLQWCTLWYHLIKNSKPLKIQT